MNQKNPVQCLISRPIRMFSQQPPTLFKNILRGRNSDDEGIRKVNAKSPLSTTVPRFASHQPVNQGSHFCTPIRGADGNQLDSTRCMIVCAKSGNPLTNVYRFLVMIKLHLRFWQAHYL